ncbi:MAG: cyanophycinase [Candidatus Sumerlaeia bacterium]|nr:cyanophycinase [Candidatus Sumerlaeia bacterium]
MSLRTTLLTAIAILTAALPIQAQSNPNPKPSGLVTYMTGNAANSSRNPVNGPGILLMGGGLEVDNGFRNRAYPVANGGDVVVLRTDNSNGYNSYLYNLRTDSLRPDSVETLVVDTVSKANSAYVKWAIENAELVFVAGGDQSQYINLWLGTNVETAMKTVYNRGGVLGGTSAGSHIMGDFIYDPDGVAAVITSEAIKNPYRSNMGISSFLVDMPLMYDVITDTHFYQRDRMGRTMAFMARLRQDGRTPTITAITCDERASIFIDRNRVGTVDTTGGNFVYVLNETASTSRVQVVSGRPLIYNNVRRTKLTTGQTFNLNTNATTGTVATISVDGSKATPFSPSNPY